MALKLDASYRPLEVIDALEALVMCIIGKAIPVETYNKKINSTSNSFQLPAVIVLKSVIKFRFTTVACNRPNIIWRDKNQCQYCSKIDVVLTIDHVIPKNKGGNDSWENLVSACKKCNLMKGNKFLKDCYMYFLQTPKKRHYLIQVDCMAFDWYQIRRASERLSTRV